MSCHVMSSHPPIPFSATIPVSHSQPCQCLRYKHLIRHAFHTRSIACIVLMSARDGMGTPHSEKEFLPPEGGKLGEMHAVLQIQVGSRRQTRTPKSQTTIIRKDNAEQEKLHTLLDADPCAASCSRRLLLKPIQTPARYRRPPTEMKTPYANTLSSSRTLYLVFCQTQYCIP